MSDKNEVVLKKQHIVIVLALFLILLVGGITVAFNWDKWFGNKDSDTTEPATVEAAKSVGDPDIDPNAGVWNGEKPKDTGGESVGIKIPGYPSITLPADTQDVTVALLNPEGNPCYFKFELVLKDTDETLYESKLVPPGQAITSITLSRPLQAGEYNAVIKITTASLEDQSAMNGANVETVLIVK